MKIKKKKMHKKQPRNTYFKKYMLEASKPVQVNHVGLRWLLTGLADIGGTR